MINAKEARENMLQGIELHTRKIHIEIDYASKNGDNFCKINVPAILQIYFINLLRSNGYRVDIWSDGMLTINW